jgi:hypothetical protein
MARQIFDVRRDALGTIDFDYYRARARQDRNEARSRFFRRILAFLSGKRVRLPVKRRAGIACVSY